jgi:hypothetical protein
MIKKELLIAFKAEVGDDFDLTEFSVRFLNLVMARVPVASGANANVGSVTLREVTTIERTQAINSNGFVQDGDQRLIPETPSGYRRVKSQ